MHGPAELELFITRLELTGVPYMVTGATAAIIYGQPRVTNDLDVVVGLDDARRAALMESFPESEFYVPPESVIRAEQARTHRGHFNLIHHETGYKADVYLMGGDPLHAWAMERRRRVRWTDTLQLWVASPEYVVLRKLEFYREGRSTKHLADIRAIRDITGLSHGELEPWIAKLGLTEIWREVGE